MGVDGDDWHEWRDRFRQYLGKCGHSIYDLDFAKPVPADDPTPLLEALKMYLGGQGTNPHARQQALAERREQATEATLDRLKGLKLRIFRKVLGWAQTLAPLREDGIADIGLGWERFRRTYLRAGMIRKRYTILDTVLEFGIIDDLVADLFAPDGFWGAQR